MSETDRMKAERAAKIATEEERIKAEKEKDHDAGGTYVKNKCATYALTYI